MTLPSINFLHLTVSEIQPRQDFIGQGHYGKVKSGSHHDVAHLHPLTSVQTSINFLQLTVSEIWPGQDFQTQGHYGKVKSRSYHDVAHLHPLTNVPTKYQLPTPYGFWDAGRTNFFPPPAHPDTMGENNTPTGGVKSTSYTWKTIYFANIYNEIETFYWRNLRFIHIWNFTIRSVLYIMHNLNTLHLLSVNVIRLTLEVHCVNVKIKTLFVNSNQSKTFCYKVAIKYIKIWIFKKHIHRKIWHGSSDFCTIGWNILLLRHTDNDTHTTNYVW